MGKRREGREAAVQFLFQHDLNPEALDELLPGFWELRPATARVQSFAGELIRGVLEHREEIDAKIKAAASNYDLHRIAALDRNAMRVGLYEMLFCKDVPPVVAINEAIEIVKRFGSEESGRFVNGVLDRIRRELPRPAREASPPEQEQ